MARVAERARGHLSFIDVLGSALIPRLLARGFGSGHGSRTIAIRLRRCVRHRLPLQPPLDAYQWPGLDFGGNGLRRRRREPAAFQLGMKLGLVDYPLPGSTEKRLRAIYPAALPLPMQRAR